MRDMCQPDISPRREAARAAVLPCLPGGPEEALGPVPRWMWEWTSAKG